MKHGADLRLLKEQVVSTACSVSNSTMIENMKATMHLQPVRSQMDETRKYQLQKIVLQFSPTLVSPRKKGRFWTLKETNNMILKRWSYPVVDSLSKRKNHCFH